ncbi:MAG: VCBS repeat-containing protein [Proteobacteria bacterium]|nr:VCBS repeat-containing protein [Pseudomonadota bacterium]
MRIADSAIQLYSNNTVIEQHQKREALLVWQRDTEPKVTEASGRRGRELEPAKEIKNRISDKVSLSFKDQIKRRHIQPAEVEVSKEQEMIGDLNMRILKALFEKLTGRKFQIIDPAKITDPQTAESILAVQGNEVTPSSEPEREGYGLVYDYHESHYEYEKTEFAAGGVITTADGKTIDFSVGLSMSHEFYSEQNINIRAGDALKDPLVINFSGAATQLTQRDFSFDIDADGTRDQIAFVAPGSGFLALDKNNDGQINDGSELFGTASGNGFRDLMAYDDDGNSWIDENDAVYESLRIWSKDSEGNDQLLALGKVGVGALYLGHIETLFSVKDDENQLLGQVRATGLAVMESGRVVTMQQVDLVA